MERSYETGKAREIAGGMVTEINHYIEIMVDGLHKKSVLLDKVMESNEQLQAVVKQPEMDMEQFRTLTDKKDDCVKQIAQLDEGFQSLFDRIKDEVHANKELYKSQIQSMQQLIRVITDKAIQIQETEAKNRLLIEGQFARMRKKLRVAKQGMNVAQNYYKNMSKLNVVESQFLDKKN